MKYWMAFAYPATSWKKQRNSVILYLTSFFLGLVYFLRELFACRILLFIVGYVLYQMSLKGGQAEIGICQRNSGMAAIRVCKKGMGTGRHVDRCDFGFVPG